MCFLGFLLENVFLCFGFLRTKGLYKGITLLYSSAVRRLIGNGRDKEAGCKRAQLVIIRGANREKEAIYEGLLLRSNGIGRI